MKMYQCLAEIEKTVNKFAKNCEFNVIDVMISEEMFYYRRELMRIEPSSHKGVQLSDIYEEDNTEESNEKIISYTSSDNKLMGTNEFHISITLFIEDNEYK